MSTSSEKISFSTATLMSINIIIGAGIFFGPKDMATVAGNLSFLGWPLVGLLMFPVIWNIAKASEIFPGEGGFYNYCTQGINTFAGFIAQWAYLLGYMATAAALITVLRENLISQLQWTFIHNYPYFFNALLISIFSLLNLMSISLIGKIQGFATIIKMMPLFFGIATIFWYWDPSLSYNFSHITDIRLTIPFAIFAYWGFESCCTLGHLLKGGPKQVGKVILTAFFIAVVLYMLFHLALLNIMGKKNLITYGAASFPIFLGLSPKIAAFVTLCITGSILLSFANSVFGVSLGNSTILYFLARKKMISGHSILTKQSSLSRPIGAIFIHGIVVWLLLYLIPHQGVLTALTNIGVCIALFLTLWALLATYIKQNNIGQICIAMTGFFSCIVLFSYSWLSISPENMQRLLYSLPLIAGLILGIIMYQLNILKKS